ncbi:MAG: type VI secretion system contractile sheath large subunit [Gammaproteobacteria bacterium]|nr:type VI secretion system contractile sheath large subunit [Gammaproteobacteria bacterium]
MVPAAANGSLAQYLVSLPRGVPTGHQVKVWLERNRVAPERVLDLVDRAILDIDKLIQRQLDQILHHPRFQQLEASWRGLHHLVETQADYDEDLTVKIKLLDLSWRELAKDVTRAIEFDQSQLFRHVYSEEFDMPGGEPFGVLLGDYQISHRPRPDATANDVDVIAEVAQIATAALCPFITNASRELFGVDEFDELGHPLDMQAIFKQQEYIKWRALRKQETSRFVGVILPQILMRVPYRDDGTRAEHFPYNESSESNAGYLWGNACYAFGGVLIRAFANTNWFADIRGGIHEFGEGGVVRGMTYAPYDMDSKGIAARPTTNARIDDYLERELSDLGFIPLCSYHSAEHSVFYSNSSLHEPADYGSEIANINARLSAMLQYMLCVSRFGHYIKVMGRDKVGSFANAIDCQTFLQNWLNQYTITSDSDSAELKARYPLAGSKVEVREKLGRPGFFTCVVHLQPHFQLDQLVSSIKLVTELAIGAVGVNA